MTTPRPWALFAAVALAFLAASAVGAEPRLFDLTLKDGLTLKWTTNRAFTLHLHGYDLEARLVPRTPVELRFTARATGRFPLEIHGPGTERTIGHLEVHPR